jgi:tetratricopeptide (TPR) repeat protein
MWVLWKQIKRLGFAAGIVAGLFCGTFQGWAASPQADPGGEAASRAYQENVAGDYSAAIRDFQEALAENPANTQWRKDLAYAYVSAGSLSEAAKEFQALYRANPSDPRIALEIGYLSQQLLRDDDAVEYFRAAQQSTDAEVSGRAREALANLQAAQLRVKRQKAYDLVAQGRRQEAISLFEAISREEPFDSSAALQLAYLYSATGRSAKARPLFESLRDSPDQQIASQAAAALEVLRRDSSLWFGSVYLAPFYQSRFDNEINPLNAKVGLRLNGFVQPYLGFRFTRDRRSRSGTLPQIFSDNSAVLSLGLQSPIPRTGVTLYAEAGTSISLLSHPDRGRAIPDYRAGVLWFRGWGKSMAEDAHSTQNEFSQTGSAYADLGFYSRYDNNGIGSLQLHHGVNLPTSRTIPIQVLATINIIKDTNRTFYNNVVEVGPHLRIVPLRQLASLVLEVQYLRGFYLVHDSTNPYKPRYGDFRVFLIWSKYF